MDPSIAPLRAEPRDEQDLILSASNSWVVALDNLSTLKPWLSDALCRLATGGGFSTRELYTDGDEVIFDAMRPAILTGIEDLAARDDLLDRAVVLQLPTLEDEKRRTEREFWAAFEAARPRILGALLDALAGALRELPRVRVDRPPRMADFAHLGTAAGVDLGWAESEFLDAYEDNRANASSASLDAALVCHPLSVFLEERGGRWSGLCQELLTGLTALAGDDARKSGWPKTPRGLSGQLRRLAPALRVNGVRVQFDREPGGARRRLVRLSREQRRPAAGQVSREPGDDVAEF